MTGRLGVIGAASVWVTLVGALLVFAELNGTLGWFGAVLFVGGLLVFFGTAVSTSRREGRGLRAAMARSSKDAFRLAWYLFKSS